MSLACEETSFRVKLGMLKLTSGVLDEIQEGQKSDLVLVDRLTLINQGKCGDFQIDENDIMRCHDRFCVPDVSDLRKRILGEGHRCGLSIHLGATKMYQDLRKLFWWPGMKKEIAEFVYSCLICQKSKIEHQKPSGLLQPLSIPEWKWDSIFMDFISSLPRTLSNCESIWVIMDRLMKSAHFIPIRMDYPMKRLAKLYIEKIVSLHGIPSRNVLYRDVRFSLKFWEGLTPTGRALKSRKLMPRFIGSYHISKKVGDVAYRITLPPSLANLHDVFHVSQLRRYIEDPSHVVQLDDVEVRDNLTVETLPMRIEDREVKQLRGKEIALVKVVWGGPAGRNVTWELESQMRDSYPELFA
ncbi:uncharacterized protein LOC127081286 [Lathyrus oleraceus]|uniref:uncharacterized protein LOC127081286 n=1 Tax=Pisum sativum TaxID=3888 RepID=UPI0021CE29A4|nr:uncharacterized protein LOC127081286 [Pisum sativum]